MESLIAVVLGKSSYLAVVFIDCLVQIPLSHPPSIIIPEILGFEILPILLFDLLMNAIMSDKDNHLA